MTAPTVVLTETIGLTPVTDAESTTGWSGFRHSGGGTPSPADETNVFVQGSQAVSHKVSGSTRDEGIWFTISSADLTGNADKHVYVWAAMIDMAQLDGIAAGGFYIIVGSSTSNWNKYFVSGSDVNDGRFTRYVVDITKTPSETSATPATLTAVTLIGIGCKSASITGKAENLVCDRIDYGTGLAIEDGDSTTPASWDELFAADDNISNKYGIIQREANGTYTLIGGVRIGDGSGTKTSLWLDESGRTVAFKNPVYHNGTALVSSVDAANLYKIEGAGNGTGTTDITFGSVVGSGDDRRGLLGGSIGTDGPQFTLDFETDIADLDTVNLYGMTLQGAGVAQFSSATKTDVIGCTFVNCDEIQPNTCEFLNCTLVAPVPDRGVEVVSGTGVKNASFIAGTSGSFNATRVWQVDESITPDAFVEFTDEAASAATADVNPFPATEATNDYFCIGTDSKFESLSIDVGTAGTTGVIAWEYWTGSSWTALASVTDNTNSFKNSGVNTVVWTDDTDDWAATSLNDERPLYYVRARITTTYGTDPVLDEAHPVDKMEHHAHLPSTAGSPFAATGWNFFGFGAAGAPKWHGVNNSGGSLTLNASDSNLSVVEIEDVGAASTTVNNNVTVTLTGLIAGSEIRVYETGTLTVVDGIESSGTTFPFSDAAASGVDIRIFALGYLPIMLENFTVPATNANLPVQQAVDRVYENPV